MPGHLAQVVEVSIIRGRFAGEGAPEVLEAQFVGQPEDPVTDDERSAALDDAILDAIAWLNGFLSKPLPIDEDMRPESEGEIREGVGKAPAQE